MEQSLHQKIKELISNIKMIRESKSYTQQYIAAKLKISQNAYSKIELGHSALTVVRLFQIAQLLELETIELINYRQPEAIRNGAENEIEAGD